MLASTCQHYVVRFYFGVLKSPLCDCGGAYRGVTCQTVLSRLFTNGVSTEGSSSVEASGFIGMGGSLGPVLAGRCCSCG